MALGLANGCVPSAGTEAQVWGSAQPQREGGRESAFTTACGVPEAAQSKEACGTFRFMSDEERGRKGGGTGFWSPRTELSHLFG